MAEDRIAQALARIDAAAGRISVAANKPAPASDNADPELSRKYQTLRHETGAALAELDRLIGSLDG
jgi:hypothetical protein